MCYLSSLTNTVLLIVIYRNDNLRHGCGILIIHYLIARTVSCTFVSVFNGILQQTALPPVYCKVQMYCQFFLRYAADWIESLVAVNRMMALSMPHHYRRMATEKVTNISALAMWVFSALWALPGSFDLGVQYVRNPYGTCVFDQRGNFGRMLFFIGFYLPLLIGAVCYGVIYVQLIWRKMAGTSITGGITRTLHQRRVRMANTMFAAFVWTVVCYLPLPVVAVAAPTSTFKYPLMPMWLSFVLFFGYMTTPIVFCAMNAEYRQGVIQMYTRSPFTQKVHPMDMTAFYRSRRSRSESQKKADTDLESCIGF
ncbi:melatonin receptor type 1B-A-like [Paramacrobiotus metropolitanus]|uniref:melatonin receptor type 1B-A-like n=1 Tax=Paramacrobiotus metropolitanus TaxID=2943436 RepID=UPI002445F89E|nr:melatonin receptor type 1B-A-like [Paramacrobiotus metropolitanus]